MDAPSMPHAHPLVQARMTANATLATMAMVTNARKLITVRPAMVTVTNKLNAFIRGPPLMNAAATLAGKALANYASG